MSAPQSEHLGDVGRSHQSLGGVLLLAGVVLASRPPWLVLLERRTSHSLW